MSTGTPATPGRRLPQGGRIDRSRPLNFMFDGRRYVGFAGDTLASALLAQGVVRVGRSWKYHRPRGILSAGVEEPNALVQLWQGARTVPNARMTEVELVEGLTSRTVHDASAWGFDPWVANDWFARLIPAGFYYKTFMASQAAWHFFERRLRAVSGLGAAPALPDPDHYAKRFAHCDVLVVGSGVAGLAAALAAGRAGARVILCEQQAELGGWLLSADTPVAGLAADSWRAQALQELAAMKEVTLLPRTSAFGYHDHNLLTLAERCTDHRPYAPSDTETTAAGHGALRPFRERLWKVRAAQVVLATGAIERPLVFSNNDLPGVMLASAVSTYIRRYAVLPGAQAVVFTNNGQAYDAAMALHAAGAKVQVVDARASPDGDLHAQARRAGIAVRAGQVVTQARGRGLMSSAVSSVWVQGIDVNGALHGAAELLPCDLLAVSGGMSPVIHLQCQSGAKPVWHDAQAAFLPGPAVQAECSAGAAAGACSLQAAADSGARAGQAAARAAGFSAAAEPAHTHGPSRADGADTSSDRNLQADSLRPLWLVPHARGIARAPKQFVDLQNDVTSADIALAVREGFESIEHIKRYTALGFGTDQGKTGNINGMGIAAQLLGKQIPQVGTTTFRPNYTPVTFGALAGLELGDAFDPVRTTAMQPWHLRQAAVFEDVGQWKRPRHYPRPGEDMDAAVRREVLAVRHAVGMLDASTLGKIDIQGPDAALLLNWIYCNAWSKLEEGKCRYGLMLDENGMVFDDGVTVRLGPNHYLMHTTTGGAARVLAWMERWLQIEWPHLRVYLTSVTDHWATTALAGPKSRMVLRSLCTDVDFSDDAFPFMSWRAGTVAGVAARLMRISFSGERCYEVNVPAADGLQVWQALHAAGAPHGITPYGTEAMHVLRAEKGYIIVGQDTDGSVTPFDLGMGAMVAKTKDCLGKRSLSRSDMAQPDRKQFVGLLTNDPARVLPEGAALLRARPEPALRSVPGGSGRPQVIAGHVTSSYFSPTLGRSIALALLAGGAGRIGQTVQVALGDGRTVAARVASPVFFDPRSERQHA